MKKLKPLQLMQGKEKGRKNADKKNTGGRSTQVQDQKKKDLSKNRCFRCHTFGRYASQYPQKKRKGKRSASTVDVDDDDEHLPQKKA